VTAIGLGPAPGLSVTVRYSGVVDKFNGFGVIEIVMPPAEIETVAGMLLANWSLTISCATYVPAISGTNVGNSVFAPASVAVLPAGTLRDHIYAVIGTLAGSNDELPLSDTEVPTGTLGVVVVGTATGGGVVLVIVTVVGLLLRYPLSTTSCAEYVPGKSATKVGFWILVADSDAALPDGNVGSDQL
jgi:hypothetical protein